METNKKRRGEWTEQQLKSAIESVKNCSMSQRQAAATFSIPRRTLRNHLKSGSEEKRTGRATTLSNVQEKDLARRIIRLAEVGVPLTRKIVRKQAYLFCKSHKIPNSFNDTRCTAGRKWLKNFLKRNPEISVRKAQFMNSARAQKLNKDIVQQHFTAIKKLYDELDIPRHPERLYNIDEKGCRLTLHHQQYVLAQKGNKRVHFIAQEHAENVTIAMCVNASGNSVPPMIIFKGKRLRPEFNDNLPDGTIVKMAPKGSMTTDLFIDFIHHLGNYKSPGKCLLVFDGAASHLDARIVDAADENNIVLYCLPSNTTHELQPLDKSVNKSYEHHWDEEVLLYAYRHPDRKLTKARFNKIFSKVWPKCVTQDNIKNGFRATGLHPYNPNAIPEQAFAPSILTQRPILHETASNSDDPEAQNFGESAVNHNNDSNTDCEESLRISPSLITEYVHVFPPLSSHSQPQSQSPTYASRKLVDYSSSSESAIGDIDEQLSATGTILCDRESQFHSPIPSTSGLVRQNVLRRPVINSSASGSDDENIDINVIQKCCQHSARNCKIYTSSESDEENLDPSNATAAHTHQETLRIRHGEHNSDDSDNEPLSNLKQNKKKTQKRSPFHEFIPTPNFAIIKSKPRRKAINYIGQRVTKDLFDAVQEKKVRGPKSAKTKNTGKKQNIMKKLKYKKVNVENRGYGRGAKTREDKAERWYCRACKSERIVDMRQCIACLSWYHEECVGLTKNDIEDFLCPECN
ncbi:unnamed protein product, partial [Brenthis ino]